ncbi:hypothetical protein L580_0731 [Serratia fonticola AU-P3(3)]|nr:hypothetical protein L580_0731 [Serratia fonticola AU-P3(3)]
MIFSYQGSCFGTSISVEPGKLPWVRGNDNQIQRIYEVILPSGNLNIDAEQGNARNSMCTLRYLFSEVTRNLAKP